MNHKFYLLKLLPIATFLTLLLPTPKIVRAANLESIKQTAATQQLLTEEISAPTYIAAAPKADKGAGKPATLKKIVLSKKAQNIEFILFASVIGLGVIAPEFFFKSKKKRGVSNSQDHQDTQTQELKSEKTVEPDLEFLKVISEKVAESNGKVVDQTHSKSA
ncbi:MAG: hypothetical protein QNJ18_21275 [Xenococcaceae cyanobacterium MO_167.B52]|nr:hypothetical protein [Xenococcaceae cyanobacterium MO_167.B52]